MDMRKDMEGVGIVVIVLTEGVGTEDEAPASTQKMKPAQNTKHA
jgi:hypothetical protein